MPRRRRGRPRKAGARHRSGDLRRSAETPRQVAAGMPHRRGLGEQAADQRAETELGRLVLRGVLDQTLGLVGETYLALWRGYVFSLAGPAELGGGGGHGFTCDGCETVDARRWCRCAMRRRIFTEAREVLSELGSSVRSAVELTVLHDMPLWVNDEPLEGALERLQIGLTALAFHFGLQRRKSALLGNAASHSLSP